MKTKEEFNLSEKIQDCSIDSNVIQIKDIKEFIKRLKEDFSNYKENPKKLYDKPYIIYEAMIKIINKLAGEKLT